MGRISITQQQRKRFVNKGRNLIKNDLTTGFQLEDFNPKVKGKRIQYGHDNPIHINQILKHLMGNRFPRESYYKWDKSWTAGVNTKLLHNKTLAHERGEYVSIPNINKGDKFFRSRTIKGNKGAIPNSWDVPDIRIHGSNIRKKGYKNAYLITKKIDSNTRLSLIATKIEKMRKIKEKLKNERVRKIQIQNYKKHSFFNFINSL